MTQRRGLVLSAQLRIIIPGLLPAERLCGNLMEIPYPAYAEGVTVRVSLTRSHVLGGIVHA